MGAEEPMMRARLRGGPCPVSGHGSWCEFNDSRDARDRRDDNRHAAREVRLQLEVTSCPLCGWDDYHPYTAVGWTCVWCRHVWSD